jgi:type IV pilus assembly protein PilO
MKLSEFDVRQLDFKRMGGWPPAVKGVFVGLILVVIIAGGWWWKVEPMRDELRQHQAKEVELLETFEYKQAKVVNLEAYKAQLEEMKELLRQMLRQLPSKTEMPDLLVDVSQTALSTGIDVQKFTPGAETVKEFYAEKPITLRMVGSYHQFGSFVSGVASLPRVVILTMHDISLKPQGQQQRGKSSEPPPPGGQLVLEGTVKTYRYVEEEEPAAAAPTPAAAAKKPGRRQ